MTGTLSIRARMTLVAGTIVGVALGVASFAIVEIVEKDATRAAEEAVRSQLVEQAADSSSTPAVTADGFRFGVFRESGELAFGRVFLDDRPVADVEINLTTRQLNEAFDPATGGDLTDAHLRERLEQVVFVLVDLDDDELLVGVASPADIAISTTAVRRALVITVPLIGLGAAVLAWWLIGRALRPVHAITDRTREITNAHLAERVPVPPTGDELAVLAATMNGMLDRLADSDARLRRFAADASHELRSPLSVIRAAAEMIERNPSSPRVDSLASDVLAESDRMERLIADLLEVAKREVAVPARHPVDIVALVASTGVDVTGDPVTAAVDAAALQRAVSNLVDNARRHAASAVCASVVDGGPVLSIVVEDDGPGVPVEHRTSVFERFTRLDDARSREGGGFGLGLAIVRTIVEAHGGTVHLDESPALGGARFEIRLPSVH